MQTNDVYPVTYAIHATDNAFVVAGNNHWGEYPAHHGHFYATGGANIVEYYPGNPGKVTNSKLASDPSQSADIVLSSHSTGGSETMGKAEPSMTAMFKEDRCEEAMDDLISGLDKQKEHEQAYLSGLAGCYMRTGATGFRDFLDEVIRVRTFENDKLYAATLELENLFLIREEEYEQAAENYTRIKNEFSDDPTFHQHALFGLGYLHYERLENTGRGAQYFGELVALYPDEELGKYVTMMYEDRISEDIEQAREALADETPVEIGLNGNYPNPYNPVTQISFDLPENTDVLLEVYDLLGRRVAVLVDSPMNAGSHTVNFDASQLASGMYIYRMVTPSFTMSKMMTLIK
ncbi:MAG: T9SS type A sorting domain-containing protein [Balneolales bacterium]